MVLSFFTPISSFCLSLKGQRDAETTQRSASRFSGYLHSMPLQAFSIFSCASLSYVIEECGLMNWFHLDKQIVSWCLIFSISYFYALKVNRQWILFYCYCRNLRAGLLVWRMRRLIQLVQEMLLRVESWTSWLHNQPWMFLLFVWHTHKCSSPRCSCFVILKTCLVRGFSLAP